MNDLLTILQGDAIEKLKTLPDESVHCCVTSPPYWGLRDYGVAGQIGLERTPEEYVAKLVEVFQEVRRVLREDGTAWVNLGDSYASKFACDRRSKIGNGSPDEKCLRPNRLIGGLKEKDLVGIPWAVAKALQQPYYTGAIKSELDRVWLAAIIDAEGSICGFTHKRKDNGQIRNGIHVTVTNSNSALLDKCFEIFPTTREKHNMHGEGHFGGLPTWRWIPHGIDAKSTLLQELYPYLVAKKKQAMLAWNFLQISKTARGRNKREAGENNRDRYAWIVHALSKLNHLETIDVPGWCVEPPPLLEPGWYLRSDIIWHKPNPMPESVTDRPTKAHEYLFLLSKSERYHYDAEAIKEQSSDNTHARLPGNARPPKGAVAYTNGALEHRTKVGLLAYAERKRAQSGSGIKNNESFDAAMAVMPEIRNKRSVWTVPEDEWVQFLEWKRLHSGDRKDVWTVPTAPYSEAHFATFPPDLIKPCILAGCPVGGTVLDPFGGSGTTGQVALELGRKAILIELNPAYVQLIRDRCNVTQGLPLM